MSHPRFSIIPAGAVTDRSLEPRDLQVLCLLGRHTDKAGWCMRSQVKMAQELGCSRGSIQNSLERLSTAGWIEMKRRDIDVEQAGKQPSRSYAYRVLLDRDDYAFESVTREAEDEATDSYAETASEEGGCQPAGTPPVPIDWHPGANACVSTRANTCDGTKNDPLERPLLERERDARARDRKARFLVSFEARWPTAAADDRQRTAYAAEGLTEDEEQPALAGIGPFLENLKRLKRDRCPAGWRYLEEKRWTLLEKREDPSRPVVSTLAANTPEAKAVLLLHEIGGVAFPKHRRYPDGSISYNRAITPQIAALSEAPAKDAWIALSHQQAGAWEALLRDCLTVGIRRPLRAGNPAPWPWPPRKDGTHSTTGPPETLMTEQDMADFKS